MLVTMPVNVEKRKPHFARKKQKRKPPAKGSTVPEEKRPPHLIADGTLKRCSACGYPFPADIHPSMSVAFANHLLKAHQLGLTGKDINQPAARITEATEKS